MIPKKVDQYRRHSSESSLRAFPSAEGNERSAVLPLADREARRASHPQKNARGAGAPIVIPTLPTGGDRPDHGEREGAAAGTTEGH